MRITYEYEEHDIILQLVVFHRSKLYPSRNTRYEISVSLKFLQPFLSSVASKVLIPLCHERCRIVFSWVVRTISVLQLPRQLGTKLRFQSKENAFCMGTSILSALLWLF